MPIATQNELTASAGPGLLIDSPNRFISPHVAGTNVRGLAAKTPVSKTGRRRFKSCRACKYPIIEWWSDSEVAATVAVSSMASCCDG